MARKCKGRQKIEMTRMSKESNLLVTFSKRRSGLFKKASELSTLCGVEIAIIVFSPGKKVFSFGHPCVDAIVDRFLARSPAAAAAPTAAATNTSQLIEAHRNASVRELNVQLMEILNQFEVEKKRGEELTKMRKENQGKWWWESPVAELRLEELEQLKVAMEELKSGVGKQMEKLVVEASNPNLYFGAPSSSSSSSKGFGLFDDAKASGLGLSVTPHHLHGFASFGYGGRGFF
ncbi:PREDICTED: agamous-like MADS-box protein AGL62 [Ipomoea nil]|uniref:agamous-like MADS-box protein AGL62 n=1 Tax=Ipomoea nil TaxID=35883 RepID=UPI000900AC2C|nr:PREDICTED: agamous-like MADS-box protein AGL62 [Ipomoea nil]